MHGPTPGIYILFIFLSFCQCCVAKVIFSTRENKILRISLHNGLKCHTYMLQIFQTTTFSQLVQSNVFCFSIIVEEVRIFSLYESSNISHRFHIGIPLESIAKGNRTSLRKLEVQKRTLKSTT